MSRHALSAPEWLRRSAVYQINPRTFSAEGTLKSIEKELPALRGMGFRVLYLCPIFPADPSEDRSFWSDRQKKYGTENPKNPYRMNSYFGVDEEYGTEDDLKSLISHAHAMGMRVLLDLVYLHIGPNAPILKTHPEFAVHDENGNIKMSIWHFPYINFDCPGLREYLWCNMVYDIAELDVDGFRCDVGDGVPLDFWEEGRRRIRAVKPDAVMINEGSNWEYLTRAFDASYCFAWHEILYKILGGKASAADLREYRAATTAELPEGALLLLDMDNHDTVTDWPERAENVAGHEAMDLIEILNYLSDGLPMVYAGNELADPARINMFANRFHMGQYEVTDREGLAGKDFSLRRQRLMTLLNKLRSTSPALYAGKLLPIPTDCPKDVIAFRRVSGEEEVALIGNLSPREVTVRIGEELPEAITDLSAGFTDLSGSYTLAPWGRIVFKK